MSLAREVFNRIKANSLTIRRSLRIVSAAITRVSRGTAVADVGSIANGASATVTVPVPGAALGDTVQVGCSVSLAGLGVSGVVTAADTVQVVLNNNSGGAIDPANATYTAIATRYTA